MSSTSSPVFIVGAPRSGTTLTARILNRSSMYYMPGELHYFDDVYSIKDKLGTLHNNESLLEVSKRLFDIYGRYNEPKDQKTIEAIFYNAEKLAQYLRGSSDYCDLLERFMRAQCEYAGKPNWGNNAPRDIFNIKEILKCFPDAKFIVCIRDIRAFLLSYQGKWKNTADEHVERLKKLYHPVVTSYLWKSSIRQIDILESLVPASDILLVRYEELVTHPRSMVEKICQMIGIDYEDNMLEIIESNSSHGDTTTGIYSSSIDKWKEMLSPEEIHVAQDVASKEMAKLGYQQFDVSISRLKIARLYMNIPLYLVRALRANKEKIGSLGPYLMRRLGLLIRSHR